MKRRRFISIAAKAAVIAAACTSGWAIADTYPSRPIRLIVPFAAGGSTDVVARIVADQVGRVLGQAIVVDNKGGAGGAVGTIELVRNEPDGYTLAMVTQSIISSIPAINPKPPYNPVTDLTPIINVAASPSVLVVRTGFPAKSYKTVMEEVKKHPDDYTYGTPGVGGIVHLQMELFKGLTGTSIRHVPFRGSSQALLAVVSNQVDFAWDSLPSVMPYIKQGQVVPLATNATEKRADLPGVPRLVDVGITSDAINRLSSYGIVGPKGMKKEIVDKLNAATKKALEDPGLRKRLADAGALVVGSTPEAYGTEIKEMYGQMKQVVAERHLKMD